MRYFFQRQSRFFSQPLRHFQFLQHIGPPTYAFPARKVKKVEINPNEFSLAPCVI
jgi:hypothetical protein